MTMLMFTLSEIASIANYYSSLITAIATLVLAIVTGYYAWLNRKLVKIFKIQSELIGKQLELMNEQIATLKKTLPSLTIEKEIKEKIDKVRKI